VPRARGLVLSTNFAMLPSVRAHECQRQRASVGTRTATFGIRPL
jgi:hypothetical protein